MFQATQIPRSTQPPEKLDPSIDPPPRKAGALRLNVNPAPRLYRSRPQRAHVAQTEQTHGPTACGDVEVLYSSAPQFNRGRSEHRPGGANFRYVAASSHPQYVNG